MSIRGNRFDKELAKTSGEPYENLPTDLGRDDSSLSRLDAGNFGGTVRVSGAAARGVCGISYPNSKNGGPHIVYAEGQVVNVIGVGDFFPFVRVTWGSGGSRQRQLFDCTARQRIPLCASTISVDCLLLDRNGAAPTTGTPVSVFNVMISPGLDGIDREPTEWVFATALTTSSLMASGTRKVMRVRGYNNSAAQIYVQVHDLAASPPGAGVTCLWDELVGANSPFDIPFPDTFFVGNGLVLAASSTPVTYTAIAGTPCRFDAELGRL